MALWGNQDSKTASGTIAIASTGVVTGTSTAFTTQAKVGNYIKASGVDYQIAAITSDTAALVTMGRNNGNGTVTTVTGGTSYTLSEKPAFVAHESATKTTGAAAGRTGDANKVFGVDVTEMKAGGDNIVEIGVASGATRYLEVPGVTVAAPAAITVATTAVTTATSTITITNHKYLTGTKLTYSAAAGTVLGGLTDATAYYVITVDANTIKLATSLVNAQAGTAITLTGTGNSSQTFTGDTVTATAAISAGAVSTITVTAVGSAYLTVPTVTVAKPRRTIPTANVNTTTTIVTYTAHGLVAGDAVAYNNGGGASATGLTSGTTYYVATASLAANTFEVKAANTSGTLAATVATSGTGGQFTCGNSTLAAGDRVTITGTLGGTGTITGYTTGKTYKVSAVTGTSPSVTGFTLTLEDGTAIVTTAGTLTGLTYTTETVIAITGTGNAAQYFELQAAADQATATAAFGTGQSSVAGVAHAGWVRRTVGTGGRAGRVFYETLVAGGSIGGDQSDNIQFPNS